MFRIAFCVLVSVSLGLPAWSQTAGSNIAWERNWDAALAKAKKEDRPIMVAFILPGESANDEIIARHFRDRGIIDETKNFVVIPALGAPPPEGATAGGAPFGALTAKEAFEIEREARYELLESNTVSCPQFIFLSPDAKKVLLRHVWMLPAAELRKKIQMARAFHDPNADPGFVKEHRDRVADLLKLADHNNATKREGALSTLATLDDPEIDRFLVRQTGPRADKVKRLEAIACMKRAQRASALPCLHGLLKARDSITRVHAAVAIHDIGLPESVEALTKALKKEGKERVRCHLLRALHRCGGDSPKLRKIVKALLSKSGQLDRLSALWIAAALEPGKDLARPILKAAMDRNTRVRTDVRIRVRFERLLGELYDAGEVVSAKELLGQLEDRRQATIPAPPTTAPAGASLSPAGVYQLCVDAVMCFGSVYKCDRCDDWHANLAGGFVISEDGLAVTNHHVLKSDRAAAFAAMDRAGNLYPVTEVVAASERDDVAVVRLGGTAFSPAGLSADVVPGAPVTAITHPDGQYFTVSTGIVSRLYRSRERGPGRGAPRVAITADFARGSSGSPVFDSSGRVIGVVASTRSIYYNKEKGVDKNLQMVLKTCIPTSAVLSLFDTGGEAR